MTYEWGKAELVLADGQRVSKWKEYSIDSDFLTPTDGWTVTFGTEAEWGRIRYSCEPGLPFRILVDGAPQLTGWIDSQHVAADADGGTVVTLTGRDYLMPLVKSNVHPSTVVKGRTAAELVESVVRQVYRNADGSFPVVLTDNDANRQLVTGADKAVGKKKKAHRKDAFEYCQPHVNESAFEFLSRNLRRYGMWLWATESGDIVVSSPNYDQEPSYQVTRKRGDRMVHVTTAEWTYDKTNVPSHVYIRGKSKSKDWDKKDVKASAVDPDWTAYGRVFCPMFVQHDEATSDAEAYAFALQELSRLRQDERVYTCTVKGHSDPRTGRVYALDTVAHVEDEVLGVSQDLYVVRRTFRRSVTGGTTTELKMVPLGTIQFSDVDAPA